VGSEKVSPNTIRKRVDQIKGKFPPPPADRTYKYLAAIWRLRHDMGDPLPINVREFIKSKQGTKHHNLGASVFRLLIELTAYDDEDNDVEWPDKRLRSRYANALDFAHQKGVARKGVIAFMKANGGFNGCDRAFRKARKARKIAKRKVGLVFSRPLRR
jgi:hypothetical protein